MKTIKNLKTGNMINCDGVQFKKLLKIQNTIGTIYFEKNSLAACDSTTHPKTKVKCSTNPKGTPPCKEGFNKKPNKKGEMCCYKNTKKTMLNHFLRSRFQKHQKRRHLRSHRLQRMKPPRTSVMKTYKTV